MGFRNGRSGSRAWVAGVGIFTSLAAGQATPSTRPTQSPPNQAPPSSQPATRSASDRLMMNFKDASLDTVLDYLSQFGGFVVVREGPPVTGVVNVLSKQPVTRDEAVAILSASLKANGFYRHSERA